jgi:MFS family permease
MSSTTIAVGGRERLQRRTVRVLLLSQVFAGAGLAAGVSVGALLAQDMLGSTGSSGLPTALFTIGSAAAAMLVGRISQRSGRRIGLTAGYAVGAIGGAGVVLAAALDSVPLLFAALVLYGSGTATNLQARYAGGDLVGRSGRARAMSTVLVATTLGAVIGPNLTDVTGTWADALGIRTLAGPFILATAAYAAAGVAVATLLRPDPLLTARQWAIDDRAAQPAGTTPAAEVYAPRVVLLAGAAMVITQMVMVAIMTMTPVHMHEHGHGLGASGLVISIHIAAMYLPSPLSGSLVDRYGRGPVLVGGGAVLLAAGLVAGLAPADSTALLAVGLALLGFGWSLGLAAGTAMVTDAVPLEGRARTQGMVDVSVAVAGATGGLASGYMVATTSYTALSLAGGVLGLLLLPIVVRLEVERHR